MTGAPFVFLVVCANPFIHSRGLIRPISKEVALQTLISKCWRFDAAHHLPNHGGKCRRPHGHTYTVTVGVCGEPRALDGASDEGMVVDFAVLDDIWSAIKDSLDHRDLNDLVGPPASGTLQITTSEHLAGYLWDYFALGLPPHVQLDFVRVGETLNTYAEVRG